MTAHLLASQLESGAPCTEMMSQRCTQIKNHTYSSSWNARVMWGMFSFRFRGTHEHREPTERDRHCKSLVSLISCAMQIKSHKLPGIIILISPILLYVRDSVTTRRHCMWIDLHEWTTRSAEGSDEITEIWCLTFVIKRFTMQQLNLLYLAFSVGSRLSGSNFICAGDFKFNQKYART